MAILTFPALSRNIPNQIKFGLRSNTQGFTSPLTKSMQTLELPGARWAFQASFRNMNLNDAALLQAFLVNLNGQAGRFYYTNPERATPQGSGGGTPVVNGAGQYGRTLAISGAPNSLTTWLKTGDYFEVNGELKMMTSDASTNSSGQATLNFAPPLRRVPVNGQAVTINNPKAIFMLSSDDQDWLRGIGQVTDFELQAIEVFQ